MTGRRMTQYFRTPSATAQAARWFAAQRRKLGTLEERESYRRWGENANNRRAVARMHALWADLGYIYVSEQHNNTAHPSGETAVAIGCVAATTLALMFYVRGPFWTSLDWITR